VIEGSNNGLLWSKLCNSQNEMNAQIDAKSMIAVSDYFQFVCLRQTERNRAGRHELAVSFFDVFGGYSFMRPIALVRPAALIWMLFLTYAHGGCTPGHRCDPDALSETESCTGS
jgi:hypothetical protein